MSPLIPLVEAFLFEKAIRSNVLVSQKSKVGFLLFGLAAVCLISALVLLMVGAYDWLSVHYAPDTAGLVTATFVLLLGAILALIGYAVMHKKQSRLKSMQKDLTDTALDWFETFADELHLPEAVRKHPKTTLAVSTLVGYLIARRVL